MELNESPEILEKIKRLREKFEKEGQDLGIYLEGLYHADYLKYWDYIKVDALLGLQQPVTALPDEKTFILYHQITELYFRLIRNSIELICDNPALSAAEMIKQLKRMSNYFEHLTHSFNIMIEGMDRDQFLKFRLALTPASGFQSAQYRFIEICSTDLKNLIAVGERSQVKPGETTFGQLEKLYWRKGATLSATGKKTLTLIQFEDRYMPEFLEMAKQFENKNILQKFNSLSEVEKTNPELIKELKRYDYAANVQWPLQHFRSVATYMERKPDDIAATGGTNWKKYLPPKMQLISFFPELWLEEEIKNWGKIN